MTAPASSPWRPPPRTTPIPTATPPGPLSCCGGPSPRASPMSRTCSRIPTSTRSAAGPTSPRSSGTGPTKPPSPRAEWNEMADHSRTGRPASDPIEDILMSRSRLVDLLLLWEDRVARGEPADPAELCRDCPELLDELRHGIADLE